VGYLLGHTSWQRGVERVRKDIPLNAERGMTSSEGDKRNISIIEADYLILATHRETLRSELE
jgi:hypothetical protein